MGFWTRATRSRRHGGPGLLLACALAWPVAGTANDPSPAIAPEPAPPAEAIALAPPADASVSAGGDVDGEAALAQALASRHWQLVLASVYTPEAAEQEAARLLSKGLEVVTETTQAKGRLVYRLTFGAFETREEAQHALEDQRRRPGFERAWVLLRQ